MDNSQDVSLIIDGHVFNVKKNILSQYSDYFRAMFSGNYVEKKQQVISIDVVNADSMVIILKYMDLGLIHLSDYSIPTIGDLAIAANFLQITDLIKQIQIYLEQELTLPNLLEIIDIAQNASYPKLEQTAVIRGLYSFKFMKPEYFCTIHKLFWYLSHPYLNTESELEVFKFGLEWIKLMEMGPDALIIVLCCLDIKKLKKEELEEMKELIKDHVNSLVEKIVDCLHKLASDFELSVKAITKNKSILCELYTEKVCNDVTNLVKKSIQRKLKLTPVVSLMTVSEETQESKPHFLSTFTEKNGFQKWIEVSEPDIWGWSVASWGPTKIVVVGGERGRGTSLFMRDVHIYCILKKEWSRHGVLLPLRRHGSVVIIDNSLFIVGGVGGFRVMLDTAIVYDLKQRAFRNIAKIPDAIQSPAVCAHENAVFTAGYKNIYKYEDYGDHDTWSTSVETDIRPNCLVSYKGYIYVTQSYYNDMYRFRPGIDIQLERVTSFCNATAALCHVGDRLIVFTNTHFGSSDDVVTVEEYTETKDEPNKKPKIIWSRTSAGFKVNEVAGKSSVMLTAPPLYPAVAPYHKRFLKAYSQQF